jgi:hypothetical protein
MWASDEYFSLPARNVDSELNRAVDLTRQIIHARFNWFDTALNCGESIECLHSA